MDATQSRRGLTLGRLLLLALLAGIAWCALSLFASTSSASAAEGDESSGSGLLGTVTQTVSGTGEVLTGVVAEADPVVTTVVETVVTPVVETVPAPVAQPVGEAVGAVTETVDDTVAAVDTVATGAVETVSAAVADVADAGLIANVAEPVVDLATSVPVVGHVIVATGLDTTVTATADDVDSAVGAVVGQPGAVGSVLPELPLTGVDAIAETLDPTPAIGTPPGHDASGAVPTDPTVPAPVPGEARPAFDAPAGHSTALPTLAGVRSGASGGTAATTASVSAPATSVAAPAFGHEPPLGGMLGGSLGGGSSASGSAGGAASAAIGHEDAHRDLHAFTTLRMTTDDTLPGAPVFDTDVSPD